MRYEIWDKPQVHIPSGPKCDASPERGRFFNEVVHLQPGQYSARVQILFSPQASSEAIDVRVVDSRRGKTLASEALKADLANPTLADHIYLDFALESETDVRLLGLTELNAETTLLRHITIISKVSGASRDAFHFPEASPGSLKNVKMFSFGTTGVCTASCVHCPTNKPDRRMAVGRMGMDLFEKIVTELRDGGFAGQVFFGLFGEPLDDALLEQRVALLKRYLPGVPVSIATNCSHFDRQKHEAIVAMVDNIAVHVESANPEVYEHFMDPLKAARVFPRVESLIQTARDLGKNQVTLTTPVHRGNIASFDRVADYFGCHQTNFSSLSNRAWDDGPFYDLAFAPVGVCCKPNRLRDEIFVDWDGTVLPCCIDFSKSMPLGNLKTQTFADIFVSDAWQALSATFRRGDWSSQKACAMCRNDQPGAVAAIAGKISQSSSSATREFEPWRFNPGSHGPGERPRLGEPIRYDDTGREGIIISGPYVSLPQGRYRIIQRLTRTNETSLGEIELDVARDCARLAATRKFSVSELGDDGLCLDFDHDGEGLLEFRVSKSGDVALDHFGATVVWLGETTR